MDKTGQGVGIAPLLDQIPAADTHTHTIEHMFSESFAGCLKDIHEQVY